MSWYHCRDNKKHVQEQIATFDMDRKDRKGSPMKPIVFFTNSENLKGMKKRMAKVCLWSIRHHEPVNVKLLVLIEPVAHVQ